MASGGNLTAQYERELRAQAVRCPLCGTALIDAPFQLDSKELDHIVPVYVGGTHTVDNVRIICRACNQRRPRDGSDYQGPAIAYVPIVRPKQEPKPQPRRSRPSRSKFSPEPYQCRDCATMIHPSQRGRRRVWCETCRPSSFLKKSDHEAA
jgi:hypothetical protein